MLICHVNSADTEREEERDKTKEGKSINEHVNIRTNGSIKEFPSKDEIDVKNWMAHWKRKGNKLTSFG